MHSLDSKKGAFWVLLISSVAPDIDYITRFWGVDVFLRYHRGITHGILALFLVPLIIAVIAGFRKGFFYYYFLSFLAYGIHIFMDLTNQYGTAFFRLLTGMHIRWISVLL